MKALVRALPIAALLVIAIFVLACAPAAQPTTAPPTSAPAQPTAMPAQPTAMPAQPTSAPSAGGMDALVAAAKQEGQLTTIALPHDWCGYGDVINGFKAKYAGITVNELNPDGSSGQEVEAIKANKDNKGPQAPDVIDVGLPFGPSSKADALIQPYKVATWDTIPDSAKDKDGYWYGDYYGVMALEVNTDAVKDPPKDLKDLLDPKYKGQVALAGDPRLSSQAYNGVYTAALGNGGSADDSKPGLDFFAQLNKAGNLVPVIAKQGNIAKGETPIVFRWDYNALADRDALKGNPNIAVIVPPSAVLAGVYVQAISAYAPHPNAAKLWMEYLYSDEGQLGWLKGYCHPIRYNDLAKRNVIPADVAAKLPPADVYAKAVFPTLDQINAAKDYITKNWDSVVGNVGANPFPTAAP
jgi:putative spermidine/putrescine transport system substrate-binding protein